MTPQGVATAEGIAELPAHLVDIRLGKTAPFKGILLNHIETRSRDFDKKLPAQKIRHEVEMGFLMNLYQRMNAGGDFWRDHRGYFSLHPWSASYQPTAKYRTRVSNWLHTGVTANVRVPDQPQRSAAALTERWPMELTVPNQTRLR